MRRLRSLILSLWFISCGRQLLAGGDAPADPPSLLQASHGGSALPWWTPILVSVALLTIALMYWWRHRPRPPVDDGAEPVDPVPIA